jgi:hypothetical protein
MSCGLWSVSRERLAAVTDTQFESQIGLRIILIFYQLVGLQEVGRYTG